MNTSDSTRSWPIRWLALFFNSFWILVHAQGNIWFARSAIMTNLAPFAPEARRGEGLGMMGSSHVDQYNVYQRGLVESTMT